jgi:hypothetical protein
MRRTAGVLVATVLGIAACGGGGGETTTVVERTVTAPPPPEEAGSSEVQPEADSGSASDEVPDVVGDRLDVAESELDDLRLPYEEIGGGSLGVVDVTAWVVCETRPGPGETADGTVKLIVARPGAC